MNETLDLTAKSILFAWELGANLGHIKPMVALARALACRGAKVTFAVRDLENMPLAAKPGEFPILQAPRWPEHRHWGHRPAVASYADVLTGVGFADPAKLATVVSAWTALLELVRPDLVVCDHAPALQVASYAQPVPLVAIGTPFTMPPLTRDRLPPIRADQAPSLPEARLLQSAKTVLAERATKAPPRLVDLFQTDERLVFGLPELDPYRVFRDEPLLQPFEPLPSFVEPPVKPRLFVYAGSDLPQLESLIQSLVDMDVDITAFLRGNVGPLPHFLKHRGQEVFDTPPPLDQILPRVSHVLSQGGVFTCHAAIMAGRPHLIMPQHNETELNLSNAAALGAAMRLDVALGEKATRVRLNAFLTNTALIQQARHWALALRERSQKDGRDEALSAVGRCMARSDQIRSARLRSAAAAAQPSK